MADVETVTGEYSDDLDREVMNDDIGSGGNSREATDDETEEAR